MTDCELTQLVGGYVLGVLEPAECEDMERHLKSCAACAKEYAAPAGLPALLDRLDADDVPPPVPPPTLEEAVLDRVAREGGRRRPARRRRGVVCRSAC